MRRVRICPLQTGAKARSGPRASTISLLPGEEPGQRREPGERGQKEEFQRVTVVSKAGFQTLP